MGFLTSRVLMPIVARLGSRTIIGVGGTLFVLNMLIPDPLPLVDEFLILAGTILLSRMAQRTESGATGATGATVQRVRGCNRCAVSRCSRCGGCEGCGGCAEARGPRFDADVEQELRRLGFGPNCAERCLTLQ